MSEEFRIRPRISINKLAEYLVCTPRRRRRIIEDAKYPKDFIVTRFNDFYEVAPNFLASKPLDEDIIVRAVDQITNRPCGTEWEESNKQLNTELLNGLLDLPDLLDIETYEVAPIADISQIMCIANVDVSVRPEILLKVTNKKAESIGALKFYLPKSYPLNQAAAEYVATIIHNFMEKNYQENTIDYRHCFVFDVPTGELYQAPRSFRRRRQEVLEACMEIADRWDRI